MDYSASALRRRNCGPPLPVLSFHPLLLVFSFAFAVVPVVPVYLRETTDHLFLRLLYFTIAVLLF